MKKKIIIVIGVVLVIALGVLGYLYLNKEKNTNIDGKKFAEEYTSVTKDNVFVYRSAEEIINILEHGTGVVYLGFPECPWCTAYVPYLNEVAKANDVDKVYYYNILNDRKDNTDNYKKMIDILKDYLKFDEEGNKRIYAPSVIAVKDGEILDFDDETAWDTKGYKTPEEYWKNEDLEGLKENLPRCLKKLKLISVQVTVINKKRQVTILVFLT